MTDFGPITALSDLVDKQVLLDRFPWLSSKLLARWEKDEGIRCYRPRQKTQLYVERDILLVIEKEMSCGEKKAPLNTENNGSDENLDEKAGTDAGTMTEAERLRAEASERRLLKPLKKG